MSLDTLVRMGRPRKSEQTDQVRVPKSVAKRIRRVAAHLEKDPGDYIAERLAGILDRDEAKMLADIGREHSGKDKPRP